MKKNLCYLTAKTVDQKIVDNVTTEDLAAKPLPLGEVGTILSDFDDDDTDD